jgi:hypothetical protein
MTYGKDCKCTGIMDDLFKPSDYDWGFMIAKIPSLYV